MPSKDINAINPGEGFDQRLDNELKRLKLTATYGVETTNSGLPANLEKVWLEKVREFESKAAESRRHSVASYLRHPRFVPESRLTDQRLRVELGKVREIMRSAGISVTSLHQVPDREFYRFLTEDLPWEEICELQGPDFEHQFVYDEYYPSEEFEVEHTVIEFFDMLFGKYYTMLESIIYVEEGEMGDEPEQMEMVDQLCDFTDAFDELELDEFRIESINARKDTASAEAYVSYTGYPNKGREGVDFKGVASFELKLDRYGYWTIQRFSLPGLCLRQA